MIEDGRVKVGSEWLLTSAHSTGTKHRYLCAMIEQYKGGWVGKNQIQAVDNGQLVS